jgi:hypothetical protein
MANYYWVGGSGTWNATDTTNWASTSGGAGGAGVPTSADNAYFDGASDTGAGFTVTIGTGAVCADLIIGDGTTVSVLDQTMTLASSGNIILSIYGSLYFPATNLTRTYTGTTEFLATSGSHTITTNGVTLQHTSAAAAALLIGPASASTATWTLGSAITVSSATTTIRSGTYDSGNYNITSQFFGFSGSNLKTVNFGSSTITVSGSSCFSFTSNASTANTTINAGTSTVNCGSALPSFLFNLPSGGFTFYNVSFTSTALSTPVISGANTFNNLTFASRAASGIGTLTLFGDQTITGTLSIQSGNTDPTRRILFRSSNFGTQRTITAAAIDFGSGIDFQDIVAAGAASPWDVSALAGGDCLNNTDITFPAAKTVYRIGTGNFSATQWASSSGGSPAAAQFPLAQDTMVFDANTTTGTHTINAGYQLGTLDMTNSTTVTLASGTNTPTFYGDITLSNAVTPSGTGTLVFSGRNTQTITSSGRTFTQFLTIDSLGGTVVLADALISNLDMTLTRGTLDLNNQTATVRIFISNNSNTRSIAFGTGKIDVTGNSASVLNISIADNFSYTGTPDFNFTYSGSTGTRNIRFGNTSGATETNSPNINFTAGSDIYLAQLGARVKNLDLSGFSGTASFYITYYGNLTLSSTLTVSSSTSAATFAATSGTQQITTNGQTLDFPITVNAPGATVQLQDDLTMGSTRAFTLTAGTLDLNSKTLTAGSVSTSNSNTRSIDFKQNGIINCEGAWTATTATGFTYAGRGRIKMSSASAKTFAGGGASYPVLEQAGAGTLTITGANTFDDITNSNATASQITFPANTTTSVKKFTVKGSAGNLMSLRSSTTGTKFTIQTV